MVLVLSTLLCPEKYVYHPSSHPSARLMVALLHGWKLGRPSRTTPNAPQPQPGYYSNPAKRRDARETGLHSGPRVASLWKAVACYVQGLDCLSLARSQGEACDLCSVCLKDLKELSCRMVDIIGEKVLCRANCSLLTSPEPVEIRQQLDLPAARPIEPIDTVTYCMFTTSHQSNILLEHLLGLISLIVGHCTIWIGYTPGFIAGIGRLTHIKMVGSDAHCPQ